MLAVLASVFVISMSGALMPGPMFATVLAKSYKSPWAGAQVSLGHAVVEVPLILLIYFGAATILENDITHLILGIVGGGMIIWMGLGMLRARKAYAGGTKDTPYNAFTAGIILSAGNPFFIIWWATVGALLVLKIADYGLGGLTALVLTHWAVDLIWLSIVSGLVYKTHRLWAPALHEAVFVACGLLLMGFGGWFVVSGVLAIG
ncbi:MAG: LysE family transporter [Dehalogenimonas sp.]|uniref:LysE family transporter n=1 Tax=Candidatus Dehalogenimonas loeffleri TaxID=3127115 RepID=A0ABZ2JC88_9CHLR|nr:LysE family transporter [Dehalogenimonas sp.]